jgi:thiol-disulfide isomerase/thioredoxin
MFGTGQYAPDTNKGQGLLTHELTHVLQQYRKRTPINSIQRKKGAQVTGAAGESPVNKRKYVRESGCDITSVSNLIGNTKVKKAMVEAIESSQWRDNPAVSAITSREIFYLILQNSDCNVEPVFGARGLIGGSYVNPPEVDKGSIDDQTVGRYNNKLVVASFHTHPPVEGYVPGPSPKDRKNMIEFPEVDGNEQYIIDPFFTYVIYRDGSWRTLGTTIKIFGLSKEQTKALRVKPDKRKVSEVAPGLGKLTRCVRDIKKAELMAGLTGERISIIEFSTSWCEPCKYLRSTLDEICDRLYKEKPKNADQLYFYKTDLEVEPSLVKTFLLTDEGVPQLLIFKGSNEVIRIEEFYDDQIYYHDFLLSKILDVLRDEPKAGKRRHLVMLDLGTTDVALTYTYRRIFWAWLNNRLRLGAEFGLGLHFSEFEEKELELSSNTRFRFDSALKLTYDPGDLGKGPFVEGKVGLVAGNKIVPEEEGLRFGLSIGGGVGYSFGRTRVGLYTDFLFTESKQNPLVNKLFVGLGLTFGSSE